MGSRVTTPIGGTDDTVLVEQMTIVNATDHPAQAHSR
jgi:hypothetical protein